MGFKCHVCYRKCTFFSLKKMLQVPIFTPNVMVYGDSGRYELRIHAVLRSIKYWIRILNMKDSRNVRKVYNMMRYDGNHQNWCGKIKELLIHFNFENVWDLQQVEQPRVFLNNLKLRVIAESDNIWQQTLQESNRYFICKNFKQSRYKEMYLNHIKPVVIRILLSRFRMGVSVILTHKYRFVNDKETVCPMCTEHEEDDIHFLLHCPVYHDLRVKYLSPFRNFFYFYVTNGRFKHDHWLKSVCIYITQFNVEKHIVTHCDS